MKFYLVKRDIEDRQLLQDENCLGYIKKEKTDKHSAISVRMHHDTLQHLNMRKYSRESKIFSIQEDAYFYLIKGNEVSDKQIKYFAQQVVWQGIKSFFEHEVDMFYSPDIDVDTIIVSGGKE